MNISFRDGEPAWGMCFYVYEGALWENYSFVFDGADDDVDEEVLSLLLLPMSDAHKTHT